MNSGKTIFAQLMEFLSHYEFQKCAERYDGNHKVNELVEGLAIALIVVIGLILLSMGWREAFIIAVAVPITFALTLLVNYFLGYTINRVTLFALTLALGLVVDDPIVDVENIYRHFKMRKEPPLRAVLTAVNEVRPPIILATLAVIISFVPLFFITGMMGSYMGPMALNVPIAMLISLVVAFTITPWMSYHILRGEYGKEEAPTSLETSVIYRVYHRLLPIFLDSRPMAWLLLLTMVALFGFAGWLGLHRRVPLKMLPFDNKNEFQIVIDMPEGVTLETTDSATRALAGYLRTVLEVTDFQIYVGTASAMDFNGMVRHYYLRSGSNVADIRVNLADKDRREQQSHAIILRLRRDLAKIAEQRGANMKLVEMPPGPPVISTVAAEVRGPLDRPYGDLIRAAKVVRARLQREKDVVDIDDSTEAEQTKFVFITDKEKAALNGVSTEDVVRTVQSALSGMPVGSVHLADEVNPFLIALQLPRPMRSSLSDLRRIYLKGSTGNLVTLGEIGHFERRFVDQTIYHKNLERVVYVFAETAGRFPAEVILDIQADRVEEFDARFPLEAKADLNHTGIGVDPSQRLLDTGARPVAERSYAHNGGGTLWFLEKEFNVNWSGEGEWDITLRVFRDLGLAFAAACLGIYVLLVYQTGSYFMPMILMISIPLTIIGIMPGFWILNLLTNHPVGGYDTPSSSPPPA